MIGRRGFLEGILAAAFSPAALATTPAAVTIVAPLAHVDLALHKTKEDILNDIRNMVFTLYQNSGYGNQPPDPPQDWKRVIDWQGLDKNPWFVERGIIL